VPGILKLACSVDVFLKMVFFSRFLFYRVFIMSFKIWFILISTSVSATRSKCKTKGSIIVLRKERLGGNHNELHFKNKFKLYTEYLPDGELIGLVGNGDVRAPTESFLCGSRVISWNSKTQFKMVRKNYVVWIRRRYFLTSSVVPLNHAVLARNSGWEAELSAIPTGALIDWEFGSTAICPLEQVLVEAILVFRSWIGAQPPFHVAQVGCSQLDFDVNCLNIPFGNVQNVLKCLDIHGIVILALPVQHCIDRW